MLGAVLALFSVTACGLAGEGKAQPSSAPEPIAPPMGGTASGAQPAVPDDRGAAASSSSAAANDASSASSSSVGVGSTGTPELGMQSGPDCWPGGPNADYEVQTQADLGALARCETIHGTLSIHVAQGLDLSPLSNLREIEDMLWIGSSIDGAELSSLHGLEGLRSVQRLMLDHVVLGDGVPLPGLAGELSVLSLSNIAGLHDLHGFAGVTVSSELDLDTLPELETLDGIRVGQKLQSLLIWNSPRLSSLQGLQGLLELDDLDLQGVSGLQSLSLPEGLVTLRAVLIDGPMQLTSLRELSRFETIESLRVSNAPQLTDLGGDGSDPEDSVLGALLVSSCPALTSIDPVGGFASLTQLEMDGCDGVAEIDRAAQSSRLQTLAIINDGSLIELPVFNLAPETMQGVKIQNNAALVKGPSFPHLTTLYDFESLNYQAAELDITGNPALRDVGDFSKLASLSMLTVSNNAALAQLALPSLSSLVWLRVTGNESLQSLSLPLEQKLSIVELVNNQSLSEIDLGSITPTLEELNLHGNTSLDAATAQRLLDWAGPNTMLTLQ